MDEFKISAESQAKYNENFGKKQSSLLDLVFCYECGETFASKKEEKLHKCGNRSNVESDNSDIEIELSASNGDKEGI